MLTTGTGLGALLLAAALLLWPGARNRSADRVTDLRAALRPAVAGAAWPVGVGDAAAGRRRWVLAGTAGVATALWLGGLVGLLLGVAVAGGADRLLRSRTSDPVGGRRRNLSHGSSDGSAGELPAACDLLAVCLQAGVPVGSALAAVGRAVPAPLGRDLQAVAALYRLGADPSRAWAEAPEALGSLGRVLVRAGDSGASVAPGLRSLAADHRAAARAATEAAVQRAGVWILAPLGLCFLPAFVCLGVVPLVLGIAADVLG